MWTTIKTSKIGNLNGIGISEKGKLLVLISDRREGAFYEISDSGSLVKLVDVNAHYGKFEFIQTENKTVFFGDGVASLIYQDTGKYVNQKVNMGARTGKVADGDRLYAFGDRVNGQLVDFGVDPRSVQKVDFNYMPHKDSFFEGAVLKGNYLYFLDREGAKIWFRESKDGEKIRYAVWQFNFETGEKIDISADLQGLSMRGFPYGEIRDLISNPEKTKLWVSTQEGVFEADISQDDPTAIAWTKILSANGNIRIEYSDGKLFCIGRSTDTVGIGVYQGRPGQWAYSTRFPNTQPIDKLVCINGVAYLQQRIGDVLAFDLKSLNWKDASAVKKATYLNVGEVTCAAESPEGLYVATTTDLHQITPTGVKTLATLPYEVQDISYGGGKVYMVAKYHLLVYAEGTLVTIPIVVDLDPAGNEILVKPGDKASFKVSVGKNFVAVLVDKTIFVYDVAELDQIAYRKIDASYLTDIAVTDDRIYVTGFNNRGMDGIPVQVPVVREYSIDSDSEIVQTRSLWNYNSQELRTNMADTRAWNIHAVNGKLCIQFESAGGNSILRWNGKDLSTNTIVTGDRFSHAYNTASPHIMYFCVVDIESWEVERGQFILARLRRGGKGNTCRAKGIYSPDGQTIYTAMLSGAYIDQRDLMYFAGQRVAEYNGGDAAFLKVSGDWKRRNFWLTPGNGEPIYISDRFALVLTDSPNLPTTDGSTLEKGCYLIEW